MSVEDLLNKAKADASAFKASDEELKSLTILVKRQIELESTITDLELATKKAKAELVEVSQRLIPDKMDSIGATSYGVKDEDGNELKIKVGVDYRTSIPEDKQQFALDYLKEEKHDGIVKPHLFIPYDKGQLDMAESTLERLKDAGFNDVHLKYDIHWQSLRKLTREMEEAETPLPRNLFTVFEFRTTKIG